jgi:glycosyltransferase involved in cell wall biosynthesis
MTVLVELTEFMTTPLRSGIQRVAGELCRFWPAAHRLQAVMFVPGRGLVALPAETLAIIRRFFEATGEDHGKLVELLGRIGKRAESSPAIIIDSQTRLLVPEVFYDKLRLAYYKSLPPDVLRNSVYFIVHDLLPLTHPEFFPPDVPYAEIFGYFHLLGLCGRLGFNSSSTRDAFYRRLLRSAEASGPVFPLGSDGLGPRPSAPRGAAAHFSVIGTIEPRKNHRLILEAFQIVMARRSDVRLTFAGRLGWIDSAFANHLAKLAETTSQFSLCPGLSDDAMRQIILDSRATVFVSSAEGFGLPPLESLWLGTPVIANTGIPSLESVGPAGVLLIDPPTPEALAWAVEAFLDTDYRAGKAAEALGATLPTWSSFAAQVCEWVES